MQPNNLEIWEALGKTDPAHTKKFQRAGGFKGTAMKPIWIVKRMTEHFGPCGKGWGINAPTFHVEHTAEVSVVYCTVSIWWETPQNVIFGVGGDSVRKQFQSGEFVDDEAFKKAFTDAVNNALKYLGVGADVHMGQFDDNKYVQQVKAEFEQEAREVVAGKYASAAHMKRELAALDVDLVDCRTVAHVNECAKAWKAKMDAENWPLVTETDDEANYRNQVRYRFEDKRREMSMIDEGDTPALSVRNPLMAGE
jgi:hypothetical protein